MSEQEQGKSQIIGSYISLITKAESRYEGILTEVDKVKKTMSLKNVKGFGTEGRRNGVNEIPPNDSVLGTVKFRVDLVKTFEIIDKPTEETEEEAVDPAIVSQDQKEESKEKSNKRDDWTKGTKVKKSEDKTNDQP